MLPNYDTVKEPGSLLVEAGRRRELRSVQSRQRLPREDENRRVRLAEGLVGSFKGTLGLLLRVLLGTIRGL